MRPCVPAGTSLMCEDSTVEGDGDSRETPPPCASLKNDVGPVFRVPAPKCAVLIGQWPHLNPRSLRTLRFHSSSPRHLFPPNEECAHRRSVFASHTTLSPPICHQGTCRSQRIKAPNNRTSPAPTRRALATKLNEAAARRRSEGEAESAISPSPTDRQLSLIRVRSEPCRLQEAPCRLSSPA